MLPDILPLDPDPPEISDEDWAARLASRMRGAYQAAARLLRNIKDPKTRERFEQRQAALEKAIKRVDDAVKRGEEKWKFGSHKSQQKWENQMQKRGWTPKQVDEAIQNGKQYPAPNRVNPKNLAIRYEHPETGRIVVRDETAKEIIQIGGSRKEGFKPSEIDDIFLR
ncbi:MAG: colicin E5-related ribonuclease [bacterium]